MAAPVQARPGALHAGIELRSRWILAALLVLFLAQAVPFLSFRWVEDESWYSSTAYSLLHEGHVRNGIFPPSDIESRADTRPLGMPVTLSTAFATLGVGPAQARLPALLLSLGTVLVAFWLGRLLGSPLAGLIAALLVSVDNFVFLSARTVRPEAFVMFFGALAVLLYFLSRRRDSVPLAILSGLALGASFNFHTNGYPIALSIGLLLLGEFRFSIWRAKRAWALVLASVAALVPFFLWLYGDPIRQEAFRILYGRGGGLGLAQMISGELERYSDFLGFGNAKLRILPFPIPLRAHIVLLIAASYAVLAVKRRPLFWTFLALLIPSLLVWPKEVNPTPRYFAILAPYFAVAVGLAFTALERPKWRMVFASLIAVVALTQVAGNAMVLRQARTADYVSLTKRLRSAIPPNARTWGAITFFLALHDRPYYAWTRTSVDEAVKSLSIDYYILNDRVLVHGMGHGIDDCRDIREAANAYVAQHADLTARVPDPFYGDLEIYRVRK